jgi:hypothetical protein
VTDRPLVIPLSAASVCGSCARPGERATRACPQSEQVKQLAERLSECQESAAAAARAAAERDARAQVCWRNVPPYLVWQPSCLGLCACQA